MSYIRPVIEAFKDQKAKKLSNTESTGKELLLFKNTIAKWKNNEIWITNAGWRTVTTRDRLQILGANLEVKKGIWHLNNVEWDGDWIQINATPKANKIKTSIYE
jgi:hypothetical protein